MKILDLILGANHNLLRNKTRTILTVIAIFVGSFSIITTTAIQTGVNSFIDSQTSAFGGDGFIQIYGKNVSEMMESMQSLRSGQPTEYKEEGVSASGLSEITAEQIEAVKKVDGIKEGSVLVGRFGSATYAESPVNGKKFNADLNMMTNGSVTFDLIAGSVIDNNAKEYQAVLPSEDWATALGFKDAKDAIGKTLTLVYVDPVTKGLAKFNTKIVGVQAPSVISGGSIFVNSSLNDALYDENTKYLPEVEKNRVYTLAAEYDYEHYKAEDVKKAISDLGLEAMTIADIVGQIKSFFDIILTVFTAFGYIALLAAAIGIINTLFMSVQERTREIGLMKSFGMSNFQIFFSFALEAVMLGFWGSVLGTAISMLVGFGFNNLAHTSDGFLASFPTFNLVEYTPATVLPIIVLVMLIAFIAGVVPARRASKKNPIDALRYE